MGWLVLIIWYIGWQYACGQCAFIAKKAGKKVGIKEYIVLMVMWPYYIGLGGPR